MLLPNAIYVCSSIILPVGKDMSSSWGYEVFFYGSWRNPTE